MVRFTFSQSMFAAVTAIACIATTAHANPMSHGDAALREAVARPIAQIADPESVAPEDNYVSGGFGDEERESLEAQKGDYNLHILSTSADGAYKGDTQIIIMNKRNEEIINALAGPIFYAILPAGTYTIRAYDANRVQEKRVRIRSGKTSSLQLIW